MRILGIDPGLKSTGFGAIEYQGKNLRLLDSGLIKTPRNFPIQNRLSKIYQQLIKVIDKYKPEVLVLEKLYSHYKHPTTAILMGHVRGIVCLVSAQMDIPLFNFSPTRIKKAITGTGGASKEQVQKMVQHLLGSKEAIEPMDVTDALALAIGYVHIKERG